MSGGSAVSPSLAEEEAGAHEGLLLQLLRGALTKLRSTGAAVE